MTPRKWLEGTKVVFGAFVVDREYVTRRQVDVDFWVPQVWLLKNLQKTLNKLPAPASVRLTLAADVTNKKTGKKYKTEVSFNTGTDETVEEGLALRSTLPEPSRRGSSLLSRVFGPGGGYERLVAAYGKKAVSTLVKVELRFPEE